MTPADVRRSLTATHQALVGVDPLVGDAGDLCGVREDAGDERAARRGQLILRAGLVEGVLVAVEERDVRVHARAGVLGVRLGHEARPHALAQRDLTDDRAEGHDVVGGAQRVRVAQVDLLLARAALVVRELHGDAHLLEHRDRLTAEVGAEGLRGVVEVAAAVHRGGALALLVLVLEEVELDLGVRVEGVALLRGPAQGPLQHVPGVGVRRRAVGHLDVAEHAGRRATVVVAAPRQDLERRRVRHGEHVGLVHTREALDGRAVETDALLEGALELSRGDSHRLQRAQDVGEPETHETDVALFECAENEVFLLAHGDTLLPHRAPRW